MSQATKINMIGGGLVWLALAAQPVFAAPTSAPVAAPSLGSSQSLAARDEKSIDTLWSEVAELRRKVEKPPKDKWDVFSSVSGFLSALVVAGIGFYATNVYNRRQRDAEERRKDQSSVLEEGRFDHERQKWREDLSNQITLKLLETRLTEYSYIWSRIEIVALHRMESGKLTQNSTRELANDVKKWRYSTGGLLAEPITRDAALAFQQAVWAFDGTTQSYEGIRDARRILRDALRADMGIHEVLGKSLVDVTAERARTEDLAKLRSRLGIPPETDQ